MKDKLLVIFAVLALSSAALPAQAHTGAGGTEGYLNGFIHPLLGIDHLLTMLGIGLWGRMIGGRGRWLLPALFLFMMAFGAAANFAAFHADSAETVIAATIFILGILLCRNRQTQTGWALLLTALSASGHGYVHAEEIDAGIDAIAYAAGFLSSTALLLALGTAIGFVSPARFKRTKKAFGLVCAAAGLTLLAGI